MGAGEHPDPDYEVHTDVLPLPGIQVVCRLDRLPIILIYPVGRPPVR